MELWITGSSHDSCQIADRGPLPSPEKVQWLKRPFHDARGKMYYEKLALEVGATVAGYEVVKPPVVKGTSGVDHRFTFIAKEGSKVVSFDVYQEVGEVEILRTYLKKMDTGAEAYVVCLSGTPKGKAKELSDCYGIQILGPREVGEFFTTRIAELIGSARSSMKQQIRTQSPTPA